MRSIGARLALWYAGVSTATLACLFVAGYYLLDQYLVRSLDLLNASEFAQIRSSLGEDYARLAPDAINERIRRTTEVASVLFFIEVHERGGRVRFASSNLGEHRFPPAPDGRVFNSTVPGIGDIRAGAFALGSLDVFIGTTLRQGREVMNVYAEICLILVCLMLVASLITGLALSRAAMRPVRLIQETANRIRSDNLSERIAVADVRDEISNLARLLNDMFDRLESSFKQVRRFTAEASHELKTPLSLVSLQAEKLLVEGGLTPAQEEAVQVQLEEIARLKKIIEELLFLSRAEAQAIKPDFRREDPRAFLESFASDARELAEHRGVGFELAVEGQGQVDYDPKWLRQVLFNLLQNALNVSPRGRRVRLVSDFTPETWRVALDDEGPGVPAAQREKIFDRFVRLVADEKGSGLGLAICRSVIGLHRGTIRAEEAAGGGLRMVFELPIAGLPAPEPAPEAPRIELHAE